jgi:hypothetical protein
LKERGLGVVKNDRRRLLDTADDPEIDELGEDLFGPFPLDDDA